MTTAAIISPKVKACLLNPPPLAALLHLFFYFKFYCQKPKKNVMAFIVFAQLATGSIGGRR